MCAMTSRPHGNGHRPRGNRESAKVTRESSQHYKYRREPSGMLVSGDVMATRQDHRGYGARHSREGRRDAAPSDEASNSRPEHSASAASESSREESSVSRGRSGRASPRANRSRTRPKKLELESLAEDDDPRVSASRRTNAGQGKNERGQPPMRSTTPKSNVAVAEGRNNDVDNSLSGKLPFTRLLRRSGTDVSAITSYTMEQSPSDDEVDQGIDPKKGSFDLVIVSHSESRADSSRGGSSKDWRREKSSHHHNEGGRRTLSAADAVSVAAASLEPTVQTCDTTNLTHWSSLSVRAALAVMQARGSEVMAQRAANAVLEEGKKKRPNKDLRTLATKVSIVVMECGGDHRAAAAVAVAVMNEQNGRDGKGETNGQESKNVSAKKVEQGERVPPEVSEGWLETGPSEGTPDTEQCETTSMESKRRRLQEKEDEIMNRNRALEEAARANQEKERAIRERMRALDAATKKRAEERVAAERRAAAERKRKEAEEAKRRALREREEEIERKNRELEERREAMAREERERARRWEERQTARLREAKELNLDDIYASLSSEDDRVDQLTTASMASKRRHLEEREAEVTARNRALEDAIRLNQRREAEIKTRMEALDKATAAVADKSRQRQIQAKEEEKRRRLKEKEEQIAQRNRELEEAARLNFEKEREISERMAALDAATAALLEREDDVQKRTQHGTSQCGNSSQQHSSQQHSSQQHSNTGGGTYSASSARSGGSNRQRHNGEVSVGTGSRSYQHHGHARPGDNGGQRQGNSVTVDGDNHSNQNKEREPPHIERTESKSVFEQLTGRLYSMLDMACDSSLKPHLADEETATRPSSGDGEEDGGRAAAADAAGRAAEGGGTPYLSRGDTASHYEDSYREPRIKAPTLSALTDDQRTWASGYDEAEEEGDGEPSLPYGGISDRDEGGRRMPNDAFDRAADRYAGGNDPSSDDRDQSQRRAPANYASGDPDQFLNDALTQAMNQQQDNGRANPSNPNQFLGDVFKQAMDQHRQNTQKEMAPANQAPNEAPSQASATQVTDTEHEATSKTSTLQSVLKPPKRGVVAQPPKQNSTPAGMVSKMKVGFFNSFSKKNAPPSSPSPSPPPNPQPVGMTRSRSPFASFSKKTSSLTPNRQQQQLQQLQRPVGVTRTRSPGRPMRFGSGKQRQDPTARQGRGAGPPPSGRASSGRGASPVTPRASAAGKKAARGASPSPSRGDEEQRPGKPPEGKAKKGMSFSFGRKRSGGGKLMEI